VKTMPLALLAGLFLLAPLARAQAPADAGWQLVTEAEARAFRGEEGYLQPPPLRTRAVVPAIEVLRPEPAADLKLKAPFAIAVKFRPQPDAAIVPATFKVLYGALNLDITSRIVKHVQVTPEGFSFDHAQIPVGRHKLTLRVEDEKQRTAERELRFVVE